MTNPVPGWYDDGRGRQRWWDGQSWTHYIESAVTVHGSGGISVDVTMTTTDIPMYIWLYTDPADPTRGWARAYNARQPAPAWDDPDRFADADFDGYEGPEANVIVHTGHPEQLEALHPELRGIADELRTRILARAGIIVGELQQPD